MNIKEVDERQSNRLKILYKLYCESLTNPIKIYEISFEMGIRNGKYQEASNYLNNEGLITLKDNAMAIITHYGIKTIEAAITNPDERTDIFPPLNEIL